MDAKIAHLGFIQAVIARMAANSFVYKGWSVTVAAGLTTYGGASSTRVPDLVAILATAAFVFLDAYYLYLERRSGICTPRWQVERRVN